MKYQVYDKKSGENITEKYNWVITPDGNLYYNHYGDLIGFLDAYYEFQDDTNCLGCIHLNDSKYKCSSCSRFLRADMYFPKE